MMMKTQLSSNPRQILLLQMVLLFFYSLFFYGVGTVREIGVRKGTAILRQTDTCNWYRRK